MFENFNVLFIVILVIFVITLIASLTMFFKFKNSLNGNFFNKSFKMMKDVYKENEQDLREINRMNAEMKAESIRMGTTAFKKGMTEDYVYCKHCGSVIDVDSIYCKKCGKQQ